MGYTFLPKFHLAFRRSLFYLIFLGIYLFVGSMVFFVLWRKGSSIQSVGRTTERLDFERTELLNVLYAEAIGRAEDDWALLANQKLESYERSMISHVNTRVISTIQQRTISFGYAFRYAFFLITMIGPVDIDVLSSEIKVFSILYSAVGIPLLLLYLNQCAKAISSILPGLKDITIFAVIVLLSVALIHDVFEQHPEDTPFIDALFSVYLTMTTIGCEDDKDELPSFLLYPAALFSLSVFSILFVAIQDAIRHIISPYELGFAVSYAQLERVLSGNRLEVLEENDAEDEDQSEWT